MIRQVVKNGATVIGQVTNVDKKAKRQVGTVTATCKEKGEVEMKIYLSELQPPGKQLEKRRWIKGRCKVREDNSTVLRKFSYCRAPENI